VFLQTAGKIKNMSANIILTHHLKDPFARVSKQLLNDPSISFKAKGILAYLLGKPADWKLRVKDLENHSNEGKASIRSALNELRAAGYATFERVRVKGVFTDGTWKISDFPIFSPRSDFPHVDKPDAENQHLSKNECTKNDFTKSKETKASPPSDGDVVHPAFWKPNPRNKNEQLQRIKMPADFPGQVEFERFAEDQCEAVLNYRPDLYASLCDNKWHHWRQRGNRWEPIRDWKQYVLGLDESILEAKNNC
jgi:hypothetical protein